MAWLHTDEPEQETSRVRQNVTDLRSRLHTPPGLRVTSGMVMDLDAAKLTGQVRVGDEQSVILGSADPDPDDLQGLVYLPAGRGAPTSVPVEHEGSVPLYYDLTGHTLYVFASGAWRVV